MVNKKCKNCSITITKKWGSKFCCKKCRLTYYSSPEHYKNNRQKILKAQAQYRKEHPEIVMYWDAKTRAKKRNILFSIEASDVLIPKICPITQRTIVKGKRTNDSPSLDRINPEKGYIKGNIWVISWKANRLKSNLTKDEILRFCEILPKMLK